MRSQAGFSLTEILVSIGLLSIITLAMLSFMTSQNKELSSIDEKMSIQSLQMQLTNLLQNPSFCGCFMGNHKFNSGTKTWNTFPSEIGASYDNTCAIQGTPIIKESVRIGTSKLVPINIRLENITETLINSGRYTSNLVIALNQNELTRIRKNISIPFSFQVNMMDPAANRGLSSCSVSSTSSAGFCNWSPLSPDPRFGEFICPGTGTIKGLRTQLCDPDASPSDYCFSVYCCY
jgi:prepilin-type N-terminal cleavage/methylation domain-containing protein